MVIDLTTDELKVLKLIIRHAEKHQSTVFYDLDAQWPILTALRSKLELISQNVCLDCEVL